MKSLKLYLVLVIVLITTCTIIAQDGKFLSNRIMVEGIYKRNLGNFSEVWANAAGGYISYGIAFPDHNLLVLRTGFYSNNLKESVDYEDASSVVVPLHIGGRYYFIDDRFMPFFSFMNGLNLVFENTNLEGEQEDKTLVRYAWQVGAGLSINLFSNLIFDAGVNYNSHFYQTEAMMTSFEYIFALAWRLSN